MKVLRSSLLVAAAVFAAACGDKVNVVQPTGSVHSVTVAPSTATLQNGASTTLTAAVTADAGVAVTPIVWTSSNTALASVTSAGVVTAAAAPAAGSVGICAAVGGASGCATILVTAANTTTPPSVSIASVTVSCTGLPAGSNCGLNDPVNPLAVTGQMDVRVNVTAGSLPLTGDLLTVLLGTKVVGTQTFTAAQAALVAAAASGIEAQVAPTTVVFSVNTAAFDTTTGIVSFPNGVYTLAAKLTPPAGGTAITATNTQTLTFANANNFWLRTTTSGSKATSATGFSYRSGNINASVLPVIYTAGVTMAAGTITFGTAGCDLTGPRTLTLTAPATGSTAWTAVFTTGPATNEAPAAASNFLGYEFRPAAVACPLAVGEGFTVTAEDNNGNTFVPGVAAANGAANSYRMDNVAPPAPVLNYNILAALSLPNGRTGGWLNDAVTFNGLATSALGAVAGAGAGVTSNGLICDNQDPNVGHDQNNCLHGNSAPVDNGVGGVTFAVSSAATSSPTTAGAAASLANATTLPPSATNSTNCGIAYAIDALGNKSPIYTNANLTAIATAAVSSSNQTCSNLIAGTNGFTAQRNVLRFGVDRVAPTIAWDNSSLAANARINTGTLAGEFVVTVADTGAVGNSGMAPIAAGTSSGPVLMNMLHHSASGTTNLAADGATSATALLNTGVVFGAPLGHSSITAVSTVGANAAYWTASVLAQDAAGNQSAVLTRTVVGDNNAVIGTAPAVPATITGAFSSASFLNDNLSIRDFYYTVGFTSALIAPTTITVAAAPTVVDAYNAATFSNTNFPINTTINTYLGLQNGQGGTPAAYAANSNPMAALNLFARDQTQAAYTAVAPAAVAPTAPSSGVSITNFTGAYAIATSHTPICALAAASAGCTTADNVAPDGPGTVTFTATATGATATFNNPFSRVDFYASNGTDLVLIGSVSAGSASLVDNGLTRVWSYALALSSANALFTQLGGVSGGAPGAAITRNVYAFGANSAGTVALVSPAVAQTINP